MALVSLWQDRHPARDLEQQPVEGHADVVVVGGGITGLMTALLLGRAGRSVTLLEAEHVGHGTTGRSTAKVSLLQGTQLSQIAQRHAADVVVDYVVANTEAQAWVARFCDDHQVDVQRRPAYTYAHGSRGRTAARRELTLARRAGLDATWQDELDLPFPTAGAVRLDNQLQLDPMELLHALAEQATAHGVRIVEGARVLKVRSEDRVRVETESGTMVADRLVVATNMPILDRGGFFARAHPARSYGIAFATDQPRVDGMYLSADAPSRSLRDVPTADGSLLLVGGAGHTTGRGAPESTRFDSLRRWTAEHYPGARETHAWSAQDYVPAHALPYVGPLVPRQERILVAGGYSKWGMTNGVAAALALAAEILGGHIEWARVMRTWSRHEVSGAPEHLRINGEVGFEMARGWVRPLRPASEGPQEGTGRVRYDHLGAPTAEATVNGHTARVSAVCTHLGGIVRFNDAERTWDCPLHGSRFGPDGEVVEGPAVCGLRRA
ncbi:FAD-dependent oxidoreductase [Nocardioides sp. cx-169]|uniref:FAD-dependent oxidoreductase n=1 Tax=Nocardioides sp. cx-169 TaxID=2899080 RepID=UPI001E462D3B|nr:FAD-dependent oxidoreductase [Nocardioides sp. cx-169]MCD4534547.1 FAD-dependent oxidoreductase [Nocardioides sp. cx-169]